MIGIQWLFVGHWRFYDKDFFGNILLKFVSDLGFIKVVIYIYE